MEIDIEGLKRNLLVNIEPIEKQKKQAAVIIPIVQKGDSIHLLFEKRVDNGSLHGGQISFPGGSIEPQDKNFLEAALRETEEEIGIQTKKIEVIGAIEPTITKRSDFVVYPFVGILKVSDFVINRQEIDYLIEIPLKYLIKIHPFKTKTYTYKGRQFSTFIIEYENETVWGATARLTNRLIEKIKSI